jgi:hypothetical protein
MREIDDSEHPENDRQPDRDQYVEKTEHESIDDLRDNQLGHGQSILQDMASAATSATTLANEEKALASS